MGIKPFVHLHVHTHYSLLDGACRIPPLITQAKRLGFNALAITDHGNMFGAIEFYQSAIEAQIRPIIGMEAYIAPGSCRQKGTGSSHGAGFLAVLLAQDITGYRNLMKLATIGSLEGFYYRPRIDRELLAQHAQGLVGISRCMRSEAPVAMVDEQIQEVRRRGGEMREILGADNFYLELQDHGLESDAAQNRLLADISRDLDIPPVATNDVHYLVPEEALAQEVLNCIRNQTTFNDPSRKRYSSNQYYLKSAEEMAKQFSQWPQAIDNTVRIADRCQLTLNLNQVHLPHFHLPAGKTYDGYLRELCEAGIRHKYGEAPPPGVRQRLEQELAIIQKTGFTSYFLIVWDFIRFAKERGIPVGPGRGSAAGSVVAYGLDITRIDPLKFGLLFERFLNPERVSMPDIDIDFCYERRDEVIQYVRRTYGEDNVAQIITFGTMAARAVIRDVGRVMGIAYNEVDRIAKLVPAELNITLDRALEAEPELSSLYQNDERIKKLIDTGKILEGLARHASTHAAGVVIAEGGLVNHVPLFKPADGDVTTQYSMSHLEKIGLLKMDFLGLRTLTVMEQTLALIHRPQGRDREIDLDGIAMDDAKTFDLLCRAETMGVFQLESSGMRDILRRLRPSTFEEIIAILALYRPGPLGSGMVDDFIKRKHGAVTIRYDHPSLEPILQETYGVILYQEQVMRIASELAGFSLAQADNLRRAMSKKTPEVMEKNRLIFIEGAGRRQISQRVAEKVYSLMEYFSGYGFNKSHSAAYAMISYQTAYLKANYPAEFMCALLTSEKDNTDKLVVYIQEAKRMGIPVLPPDIHECQAEFTVSQNRIRFGLSAVKNVGMAAIESILKVRGEHGRFQSLFNFTEHVDLRLVNRRVLESLIKSGALDSLSGQPGGRAQLSAMMDHALDAAGSRQRDRQRGQMSLFDHFEDPRSLGKQAADIEKVPAWSLQQILAGEKEVLGFYVSGHPLSRYASLIRIYATTTSAGLSQRQEQEEVSLGGMIARTKEFITRRGDKMAFFALEDLEGTVEALAFPEVFKQFGNLIQPDQVVYVRGRVNFRDDEPKIVVQELMRLEEVQQKLARALHIDLPTSGLDSHILEQLRDLLKEHAGPTPVYLNFITPAGVRTQVQTGPELMVDPNADMIEKIKQLVGEQSLHLSA